MEVSFNESSLYPVALLREYSQRLSLGIAPFTRGDLRTGSEPGCQLRPQSLPVP
jgi:hypothetical protein